MRNPVSATLARHPDLKLFIDKVLKDNIGFLASALAWSILTSMVPVIVGLVAIVGFVLRDPATQTAAIKHTSDALQGVLHPSDIRSMVQVAVQHRGLLGIVGLVGLLWGGSNVGGALSTVFQPIFDVRGRSFIHEKLIDVVMIFVFAALMIVIIVANTAAAIVNRFFSSFPLSGVTQFLIATGIGLVAAFLLFCVIYGVFPNTETKFKLRNMWFGATFSAVLFQLLTYIWPLYATFSHFTRYGAVIAPILILTAYFYLFSIILLVGAEFVAFEALRQARKDEERIGPCPDGTVPQHDGLVTETVQLPEQVHVSK